MKTTAITDWLTEKEIEKAMELKKARLIKDQIIEPNIARINVKIGQENDPMYLAYMVEFVVSKTIGLA